MPLPSISSLAESDTFQTLFNKNNTIIDRLNAIDIATITGGSGITLSAIDSSGGVTLSVDFSTIEEIGFTVNEVLPFGVELGDPVGLDGSGVFAAASNTTLAASRRCLGIVSEVYPNNFFRITTSGRIMTGIDLDDNTVYYLGNGGITSNVPTTPGETIKPILFSMGNTYGAIVLNQKETVISDYDSYVKSSSRIIAEIPSSGFSAGHVVHYDVGTTTWQNSRASAMTTAEVFGIVESIVGSTATVVTHGSISIPSAVLHDVGSSGGFGGNDIWFLSGLTYGHMQNLGPITSGQVVKPVYYQYPHEFGGITFSGMVVNYNGYVLSSALPPADGGGFQYSVGQIYESIDQPTSILWDEVQNDMPLAGQWIVNPDYSPDFTAMISDTDVVSSELQGTTFPGLFDANGSEPGAHPVNYTLVENLADYQTILTKYTNGAISSLRNFGYILKCTFSPPTEWVEFDTSDFGRPGVPGIHVVQSGIGTGIGYVVDVVDATTAWVFVRYTNEFGWSSAAPPSLTDGANPILSNANSTNPLSVYVRTAGSVTDPTSGNPVWTVLTNMYPTLVNGVPEIMAHRLPDRRNFITGAYFYIHLRD